MARPQSRTRMVVAGVATLAALAVPATAFTAPLHGGGCSPSGTLVTKQAESKSFTYTLTVGPAETMVGSAAGAKTKGLADAEVMVGGSMDMLKGATNHLEVHVCGIRSRKVVGSPVAGISLADLTAGTSLVVPVMVMQSLDGGGMDRHFGNNVPLVAGHRYRVIVTMRGETAAFAFVGPKGGKAATADMKMKG